MRNKLKTYNLELITLLLLLLAAIFFRFYEIGSRNPFGFDQADFAWQAKEIIVDRNWPYLGPQAKLSSGIYVGPAYYYLTAIVYFLTRLDPIASGLTAGLASLFSFGVTYFIVRKIFGSPVALMAIFIQTFSTYIINFDRTQWSVNLVAPVSLIIFYALYKVITGRSKYLLLLALALGFSFHLHFTAIFFPVMIFLSLPLFPRNRQTLQYLLFSLPLFLFFLVPNFLAEFKIQAGLSKNIFIYLDTYSHGFYPTRFFQLTGDALIELDGILTGEVRALRFLKILKFLFLPAFWLAYLLPRPDKNKLILNYLIFLWILVPWLGFSLYGGEITNYYFSLTRPVALMVLAYLTFRLVESKILVLKLAAICFWAGFGLLNFQEFMATKHPQGGLDYQKAQVKKLINQGKKVEYSRRGADSYIYYFYTRK